MFFWFNYVSLIINLVAAVIWFDGPYAAFNALAAAFHLGLLPWVQRKK